MHIDAKDLESNGKGKDGGPSSEIFNSKTENVTHWQITATCFSGELQSNKRRNVCKWQGGAVEGQERNNLPRLEGCEGKESAEES